MKIKSYLSFVFSLLLIFAFVSANAQIKYEEDFSNPEVAAKKLIKVNLKWLNKAGVEKAIIHNFTGEFMTSKQTEPGAFEQRHGLNTLWSAGGITMKQSWSRTQSYSMGSDYYENVVSYVFSEMIKLFEESGIEIIDPGILIEDPEYQELGLESEKNRKGYTGGVMKNSTTTNTLRRAPVGMGVMPAVAIKKVVKLGFITARLAKENDCQASFDINFSTSIGKKGLPILSGMKILMNSDVQQQGKKPYWNNGNIEIMSMKDGLWDPQADIFVEGTKKDFDLEKYNQVLHRLIKTVNDAFVYEFKTQYTAN